MDETAQAFAVYAYKLPKVHGTRFVNHQRNGLKKLLHNWTILILTIENATGPGAKVAAKTKAKLNGYLKKLRDMRFLLHCCIMKEILDIYATCLSLKFEKNQILPFEVSLAVERAKDAFEACLTDLNRDKLLEKIENVANIKIDFEKNKIEQTLLKRGHARRKEENRENVILTYEQVTNLSGVDELPFAAQLQESMTGCLNDRFLSFNDPIFCHFKWIDPTTWAEDRTGELDDLRAVASHFEGCLQISNFEAGKLKQEWKDLRLTVQHKYYHLRSCPLELWEAILHYNKAQFPNACILVELVLSIGVSNAVVESGFSRLTHLLSDRRLSLGHDTMEAMLLIQSNDNIWTNEEREELIEMALMSYLQKRRKRCLETSTSSMFASSKSSLK